MPASQASNKILCMRFAVAALPKRTAIALAQLTGLTVSDLPVSDARPYCSSLYRQARNDDYDGHIWIRNLITATVKELDAIVGV